jgi:hypothetical protein
MSRVRKRALLIALTAVLLAAGGLAAWKLWEPSSDSPVTVTPGSDYALIPVEYFQQNDSLWANETLGDSGYRMGGSGCLVCCLASALDAQGYDTDPSRLNALFTGQGVYNSEGEVLWDKLEKAVPNSHVTLPSRVDAEALEETVSQGLLPLVKVKFKGIGYHHWVLLVGASNGDYLCMDPLSGKQEPLPLSANGGQIYRYRIVTIE